MSNRGQQLLIPGKGRGVTLPPVTSGLVAYYAAAGVTGVPNNIQVPSVFDSSRNGNTAIQATVIKRATFLSNGGKKGGPTLSFNGSSDGYQTGTLSPNNFPAATISVWVYPTGSPTGADICQALVIGASSGYVGTNSSGFAASFVYDGANNSLAGAVDIRNAWHNITMTADGTTQRLYVDGTQVASGAAGNINWFSALLATLGTSRAFTADTFFAGSFDGGAIYNRALSAGEVAQLGSWWP